MFVVDHLRKRPEATLDTPALEPPVEQERSESATPVTEPFNLETDLFAPEPSPDEAPAEPEAPVVGSAYDKKFPKRLAFPATLWEAAQRLKSSKVAREWFGDDFVEHYAASREWEEREFRKHITDWEMERYFEII
ncbi:MAG: hypothetical protein IH926_09605 [Proteobacteria bacterium]|nr:hypothetical protein [Pseudomonadota bacterium]